MIELEHVSKRHGDFVAVDDVSLSVAEGEFCVIIGSSGAGKSTLLRMINQLVPHSSGAIRVGGRDVRQVELAALRRGMGYVIQSIGLFPHWTVERNIGAVPQLLGWPPERVRQRATELLGLLALEPAQFLPRYPHELSIGQQQRVGIARALAAEPRVLLMDEPFGALDPITRESLQRAMLEIQRASRTTVVFVTHDIDEALRLATRIAVLDRGRLVQLAEPAELLLSPATDFVRDLVGRADLGIKLLAVEPVSARLRPGETAPGAPIAADANLRQALSRMVAEGRDCLPVADAEERVLGVIRLADMLRR